MRFDWKERIKHLVQCLGQSRCSGTVSNAYSCPQMDTQQGAVAGVMQTTTRSGTQKVARVQKERGRDR